MKKYLAFYRTGILVTLAYRGPIIIWILTNFLSLITVVAIWFSVSAGNTIGGYTKPELITYYIVALFLQWLNGWYPFYDLIDQIKSGSVITGPLLKPYNWYWAKFVDELGWHTISVWVGIICSLLVFIPLKNYFVTPPMSIAEVLALILAVILSITTVFGISFCLGLSAFWFTEVYAFESLFFIARSLLGGQGLPVSFFPAVFQNLIRFLPFRYTFSFPLEIYFHKLTPPEILSGLGMQIFWTLVFYFLADILWQKGRKSYTAFGQ